MKGKTEKRNDFGGNGRRKGWRRKEWKEKGNLKQEGENFKKKNEV